MFTCSKLLPIFIYPLGLSIILTLMAIILLRGQRRRLTYLCLTASMLLLLVFSNRIVACALAGTLEGQYLPVDGQAIKADAIVILGGTVRPDYPPRSHAELGPSAERALEGLRLYREGMAPVIVTSGEGNAMKRFLIEFGVSPDAILADNESRNTRENAVVSRRLIEQNVIGKNILLVTSAIHMPRAVSVFEKEGFDVIPAPADYVAKSADYAWLSFMPQAQYLDLSTNAIKEWIGVIIYGLAGWL